MAATLDKSEFELTFRAGPALRAHVLPRPAMFTNVQTQAMSDGNRRPAQVSIFANLVTSVGRIVVARRAAANWTHTDQLDADLIALRNRVVHSNRALSADAVGVVLRVHEIEKIRIEFARLASQAWHLGVSESELRYFRWLLERRALQACTLLRCAIRRIQNLENPFRGTCRFLITLRNTLLASRPDAESVGNVFQQQRRYYLLHVEHPIGESLLGRASSLWGVFKPAL